MTNTMPDIPGFECIEILGKGRKGTVWKARQISLDRIVAVKFFHGPENTGFAIHNDFTSLAKHLAMLKHEGIIQIYDAEANNLTAYIVMEYVAGYTVGDWLRRKEKLGHEDALLVAKCVAEALDYAWSHGQILHGSLQPDNILIDSDGVVKVSDLGEISLFQSLSSRHASIYHNTLAYEAYISPEQALGEMKLDCRSDIYSLGAILYHLLSGETMFSGTSRAVVLDRHVSDWCHDPAEKISNIPLAVSLLLRYFLAKDPNHRPQNWTEAQKAIRKASRLQAPINPMDIIGVSSVTVKSNDRDLLQQIEIPSQDSLTNKVARFLFGTRPMDRTTSRPNIISTRTSTVPIKCLPNDWHSLFRASDLQVLYLPEEGIEKLPSQIGEFRKLRTLYLNRNRLKELPREIGELVSLETLVLAGNQIETIPHEIGNLRSLKRLYLAGNRLTTIPVSLANLKNLRVLDLSGNRLTGLPAAIGSLQNLEALYLTENSLTGLPDEIGNLSNLKSLQLDRNRLTELPISFSKFKFLSEFNVTDNLLPVLPPEIAERSSDTSAIINYYIQRQVGENRVLNEAKMVLVGEGGVGKTSLIKALLGKRLDHDERKTEGIDITRWEVTDGAVTVALNVWDFGGQEIMHATHQFFLTKRTLYILVLDSRQGEHQSRLEYWLKIIQSFGGDSPIIVVCTKADEQRMDLDWLGLQRKYPVIVGFAKAVSSHTGEEVANLREMITREVTHLGHVHDVLPSAWFHIKDEMEHTPKDFMSYDEYRAICANAGVEDSTSQKTLVQFLHDLGIVLNFQDDPRLEDTNILNPEWVTNGVYRILNSNLLFQSKGVLRVADLHEILPSTTYPSSKHMFIMDMMRKFELCFRFEDEKEETFLIPDLLTRGEPDTGEWEDALAVQYHYNILPGSVASRFIVRMSSSISKKTYWRSGVVLTREGCRALVRADAEERTVYIRITGPKNKRPIFLALIRSEFDRIHNSIAQLDARLRIPLAHHPHVTVDYEHLIRLYTRGQETIIPEGTEELLNIGDLLNTIDPELKLPSTSRRNKVTTILQPESADNPPHASHSRSGLFNLFYAVVLVSLTALVCKFVAWYLVPLVMISTILLIPIVSAFHAFNDGTLTERGLVRIIVESYNRLGLLIASNSKKNNLEGEGMHVKGDLD
ncbi:MAG: hypothetical protein A2283_19020 [Lentisphaerae bacterium RIFOXYA12_FULL_48_11]|nr:MAG: hypothetical protein A2283_19020 [Lentisphaerae bacterium RIFOXYA12_FULL_48_11]